jgi:flavin reductase (DIM6/NTAB) family NADH-FMN oxidoreductase RutF
MRKNFGTKPYLYPMPVLIIGTYDENGIPDAMNAAWGNVCDVDKISICISGTHKTMKNILKSLAFTVSIADVKHVAEADYVGIISGNDVPNKLEKAGLHTIKSEFVNAPVIEEFPMTLECRLFSVDHENEIVVGEIINISADEEILNEKGMVDPAKLEPLTYDPMNNEYWVLGKKVGKAFHDGKFIKNS